LRIEFRQKYQAPRETVWFYLHNPDILAKTLPGCKRLQEAGKGHFLTEMGLDIGPVKGLFTGTVDLLELDKPNHYRLLLKGTGKPGELEADAFVYLEETEDGTEVRCDAEAHVTGVMASVGQRIMGGVARLLLGRFFKNVESEMKKTAARS
jgi:uncharacterized protein